MLKKRIGNDISFTWRIYRKESDDVVPETFEGKDVIVELISPRQRPAEIENISISAGVVGFVFKGKKQRVPGSYTAVLLENKGKDGMVTLDVVDAVTLVPHSYMEEDSDTGDVIEATSVELTSTISAGSGTPIDAYTKAETDELLAKKANSEYADEHKGLLRSDDTTEFYNFDRLWRAYLGSWGLTLSRGENYGTIIYDGKLKVNDEAVAMASDLAGKQDTINDLATIRSGASAGATAYQKPATGIPATDLASDVQTDLAAIDGIEAVIPEQASASNKLADRNFVNSSIATATATYRGAYNLVTDLSLTKSATHAQIATALVTAIQIADNNDYCYVQIPVADATPTEIASIERYKHNGTVWEYEYTLNNSGYTAAQWAALNSGITSGLVAKLSALPTNSELTALLSGKANTADLAPVATSGNYNDLTGKPTVDSTPTPNSDNLVKSGGVYSATPSITDTDAESDLDISDEDGNVLMRLYSGHIKTKNFDSSNWHSVNIIDTSSKAIYTVANTLTNGQTMTLNKPNLKNHYTLSFSATVNTMGTITIISGSENNWSKGRVEITPTNIVYYKYGTWEAITIPHNISIQDNISVIIKTTKVHFAEIYLLANNSQTEIFHQEISWNGCGSGCTLSNANGSYSNCNFSLNCQGLLKDVWVFGDSYTDAWPLSLDELGFNNYLLDGFSGRTSQEAYQSFLKDIELAKPKAIIWMMGMNDPDNGSVNSSWKTAFDNVKTLCDTYKIEFIYATIPCVPQRNHSYKNDYAINSGVRIIPIASILGASSQGSSWYAGLLGSDDVHPSISGRLWIALTLLNNITLLQEK